MAIFQKEKLIIFFITLIVLLTATSAYAAYEDYFSFERFDRDYDVSILLPVLKRTGINPDRIVKSLDAFSSSLQFIKEDDQSQAEGRLKRSIRYWPEFLPAHFVLAQVYETTQNKKGVFKQYKIYLSLLKKLHGGKLQVTQGILTALRLAQFEDYEYAYNMISSRLEELGISQKLKYTKAAAAGSAKAGPTKLDMVFKNPMVVSIIGLLLFGMLMLLIFGEEMLPDIIRNTFLLIAIPVIIIAVLWFIYKQTANRAWLILAYSLYPAVLLLLAGRKVQRNYRLRHRKPQQGYWVCKNCGVDNPNIYQECSNCSFEK